MQSGNSGWYDTLKTGDTSYFDKQTKAVYILRDTYSDAEYIHLHNKLKNPRFLAQHKDTLPIVCYFNQSIFVPNDPNLGICLIFNQIPSSKDTSLEILWREFLSKLHLFYYTPAVKVIDLCTPPLNSSEVIDLRTPPLNSSEVIDLRTPPLNSLEELTTPATEKQANDICIPELGEPTVPLSTEETPDTLNALSYANIGHTLLGDYDTSPTSFDNFYEELDANSFLEWAKQLEEETSQDISAGFINKR